jgi:hypothetical protein
VIQEAALEGHHEFAGGVESSLPGQNGHGRPDSTSSSRTRGAKSVGRWARSATIVTHRPVS